MGNTLVSRRHTYNRIMLAAFLACLVFIGAMPRIGVAAQAEESQLTSDDTPKLEDVQGTQSAASSSVTAMVIALSESLELVVEDANKAPLGSAAVDILYSGEVVGSGVTGSDGRMLFTGLTKAISFTLFISHEIVGELTFEYDSATLGFDETLVLTLPNAVPQEPTDFMTKLTTGSGSTTSRRVSIILLVLAALDIIRMLVEIAMYIREKCRIKRQIKMRIALLDGGEDSAESYKYAKRK